MDYRSSSFRAGRLDGVPAAPGVCVGTVHVVRDRAHLRRVLPGEVVVCPAAPAAWSAVFGYAAALVTEGGGALSQAAVLAREYGIPAVAGTWSATDRVRDGDLVRVSGDAGLVEILLRAGRHGCVDSCEGLIVGRPELVPTGVTSPLEMCPGPATARNCPWR